MQNFCESVLENWHLLHYTIIKFEPNLRCMFTMSLNIPSIILYWTLRFIRELLIMGVLGFTQYLKKMKVLSRTLLVNTPRIKCKTQALASIIYNFLNFYEFHHLIWTPSSSCLHGEK